MTKPEPPRNKKVLGRATQPFGPRHPQAPDAPVDAVWDRVDMLTRDEGPAAPGPTEPKVKKRSSNRKRKRLRRKVRVLDIIGTVTWIATLTKLFVADVDRMILSAIAPEAAWLLDLRWVLVLALLAMLALLFRGRTVGMWFAYIAAYPLVVLFWKIPHFFFKRRNLLLVVGVSGLVSSIVARFKFIVCACAITTLSSLIIVLSNTPGLVGVAACALFVTLLWSLVVTSIDLMQASRFVSVQESFIEKILHLGLVETLIRPAHPDRISIKDWTADEAKAYRDGAGTALLVNRLAYFWAYSLDQFRRGPSVTLLNALAVVVLVTQVTLTFALLNYSVYVIEAEQYAFASFPEWWTFIYYSVTGIYFGEIDALSPEGVAAGVVKILNGFVGSVGVLGVMLSILVGYRSAKSEEVSARAVAMLTEKAHEIESLSIEQYKMPLADLNTHLELTRWGLIVATTWLDNQIPLGWKAVNRS